MSTGAFEVTLNGMLHVMLRSYSMYVLSWILNTSGMELLKCLKLAHL